MKRGAQRRATARDGASARGTRGGRRARARRDGRQRGRRAAGRRDDADRREAWRLRRHDAGQRWDDGRRRHAFTGQRSADAVTGSRGDRNRTPPRNRPRDLRRAGRRRAPARRRRRVSRRPLRRGARRVPRRRTARRPRRRRLRGRGAREPRPARGGARGVCVLAAPEDDHLLDWYRALACYDARLYRVRGRALVEPGDAGPRHLDRDRSSSGRRSRGCSRRARPGPIDWYLARCEARRAEGRPALAGRATAARRPTSRARRRDHHGLARANTGSPGWSRPLAEVAR